MTSLAGQGQMGVGKARMSGEEEWVGVGKQQMVWAKAGMATRLGAAGGDEWAHRLGCDCTGKRQKPQLGALCTAPRTHTQQSPLQVFMSDCSNPQSLRLAAEPASGKKDQKLLLAVSECVGPTSPSWPEQHCLALCGTKRLWRWPRRFLVDKLPSENTTLFF